MQRYVVFLIQKNKVEVFNENIIRLEVGFFVVILIFGVNSVCIQLIFNGYSAVVSKK